MIKNARVDIKFDVIETFYNCVMHDDDDDEEKSFRSDQQTALPLSGATAASSTRIYAMFNIDPMSRARCPPYPRLRSALNNISLTQINPYSLFIARDYSLGRIREPSRRRPSRDENSPLGEPPLGATKRRKNYFFVAREEEKKRGGGISYATDMTRFHLPRRGCLEREKKSIPIKKSYFPLSSSVDENGNLYSN